VKDPFDEWNGQAFVVTAHVSEVAPKIRFFDGMGFEEKQQWVEY
jgi:hypothetical protein